MATSFTDEHGVIHTLAMPSLCDSTDFGLTNERANRKLRIKLERDKPIVVETMPTGAVLQKTGRDRGYYFVVNPEESLLVYVMQYKKLQKNLTGIPSAVQTAVWRAIGQPLAQGIVTHVYFKQLLPMYGAIMSDKLQTEDGQRLWKDLTGQALRKRNLFVYLVDFNMQHFLHIESPFEYRIWEDDIGGYWSWNSMKHQGIRFLIANKQVPKATRMADAIAK